MLPLSQAWRVIPPLRQGSLATHGARSFQLSARWSRVTAVVTNCPASAVTDFGTGTFASSVLITWAGWFESLPGSVDWALLGHRHMIPPTTMARSARPPPAHRSLGR